MNLMHGLQNHSDVQNDVIRSLMADCDRLAKNAEEIDYWAHHFGVDEATQAIEHLKNHKLDQEKAKQDQEKAKQAKRDKYIAYRQRKGLRDKQKHVQESGVFIQAHVRRKGVQKKAKRAQKVKK